MQNQLAANVATESLPPAEHRGRTDLSGLDDIDTVRSDAFNNAHLAHLYPHRKLTRTPPAYTPFFPASNRPRNTLNPVCPANAQSTSHRGARKFIHHTVPASFPLHTSLGGFALKISPATPSAHAPNGEFSMNAPLMILSASARIGAYTDPAANRAIPAPARFSHSRVSTPPAYSVTTCTPNGASSTRSVFDSLAAADLEAAYPPLKGR